MGWSAADRIANAGVDRQVEIRAVRIERPLDRDARDARTCSVAAAKEGLAEPITDRGRLHEKRRGNVTRSRLDGHRERQAGLARTFGDLGWLSGL